MPSFSFRRTHRAFRLQGGQRVSRDSGIDLESVTEQRNVRRLLGQHNMPGSS